MQYFSTASEENVQGHNSEKFPDLHWYGMNGSGKSQNKGKQKNACFNKVGGIEILLTI